MSVWAKIVGVAGKLGGGAAGFAMGGPIGALMGVVAGHFLIDERRKGKGDADEAIATAPDRQAAFIMGVIALSAKMAKADGRVTVDELKAFREIITVAPAELKNVEWVFDQARRSTAGFESYARQLARLFKDEPKVLEDLMDGLFHIAGADGVVGAEELAYLRQVAEIFDFKGDDFERIRARHLAPETADPYTVLGVSRGQPFEEIKAAYRRLVKENHPDAMIARGVPEEFVALANERLAAINTAFERIERERA